jgi:carotenoid cleavage dioxygenase
VQEENLEATPSEFPALNAYWLGYPTRYGYTANMAKDSETPLFEGLIKHDFHQQTSQFHYFGQGRYGGDPSFVPRPGATEEDDGWLLNFVHDLNNNSSELVVIDAQNFTAEPVASVMIPQRVPYGFHSVWIEEQQLQSQQV